MQLSPRPARRQLISLVPLIDVMMILLVFFMVTSTYLDLDMVPVAARSDGQMLPPPPRADEDRVRAVLLVRLGADGRTYVHGAALTPASLDLAIKARVADDPGAPIVVLPSAQASVQALVGVMGTAARAGATALRVVRLEGTR